MPREFSRTIRVSENIKRVLAPAVNAWAREQNAGMASVTRADVSPDLKRSTVYVSIYGTTDSDAVIAELNADISTFARKLGHELRLKNVPKIEFKHDDSIAGSDRITRVLRQSGNTSGDD